MTSYLTRDSEEDMPIRWGWWAQWCTDCFLDDPDVPPYEVMHEFDREDARRISSAFSKLLDTIDPAEPYAKDKTARDKLAEVIDFISRGPFAFVA